MADYKAIKGHTIQTVAGDPGTIVDGLIWYDSVAKKVQGSKLGTAAWTSGGNLNNGRYRGGGGGCGTRDAGLIFGGYSTATGSYSAQVEQYNGTSWTEGPHADYPSVTGDVGQCGTTTAALGVGGNSPSFVDEVYHGDGSSWTAGGDYPSPTNRTSVAGIQTAALGAGGAGSGYDQIISCFEYDGSSWTSGGNYTNIVANVGIAGTQTAAIAEGGYGPGGSDSNEAATYNGTAWTAITDTSTNRGEHGFSTTGTTTDYMTFGSPANTEKWDGTSWTEIADVSTARTSGFSVGTTSAAFYAGGNPGGITGTEEFDHSIAAVTFTSS